MQLIASMPEGSETTIVKMATIQGRKTATFYRAIGLDVLNSQYLGKAIHDASAPEERFGLDALSPCGDGEGFSMICDSHKSAWNYAVFAGFKPLALTNENAAA